MSVREITYAPGELIHPTVKDGRNLWISPEVERLIHKLHYGDPTLGWEGDPRLALYRDGESWVLERLEADGQYRVVCRSRPGLSLDERLIQRLVEHDHRRGFDPSTLADNSGATSQEEYDRMAEAMERVAWGIHRDTEGRKQF